jgi:toluene monooxygenase system ferredoxin subunit
VAELAEPLQFSAGETVYRFGAAARRIYVLARGTVRLTTGHGGRHAVVGDLLGRGDVFGWAALTPQCPLRIATASCVTHCKMLAIDGKSLLARMEADHTLGYRLMTQLNLLVTGTLSAFAGG